MTTGWPGEGAALVAEIHRTLSERGETIAVAESVTGGLLAALITDRPGASEIFIGSVTAYATAIKERLLGVDGSLLRARGAVDAQVALAMADGVRQLLNATYGVATTGVAGPDSQDGQPIGTVFVAVSSRARGSVTALTLAGGRGEVRSATVLGALELLHRTVIGEQEPQPGDERDCSAASYERIRARAGTVKRTSRSDRAHEGGAC